MHRGSIPSPSLPRKNYLKCCFSTRCCLYRAMSNVNWRLKAVRNFIIHCKKKEGCFLANHLKTQKHSEPVLGEQMQVKQSKGESSKPFTSSVVWMAPAASSPPASALLNINTHIYNNHSCSHTHRHNTAGCVETWDGKIEPAVQQVIRSTSGSWKPLTFSL